MNTLKYHVTLHCPVDWLRYRCPTNIDAEAGESAHKSIIKAPAKGTQCRSLLLDSQSAERYAESVWIDRAYNEVADHAKSMKSPPPAADGGTPFLQHHTRWDLPSFTEGDQFQASNQK